MDDRQRLRYSRHLLLNEFGEEAQERLLGAHALVIGAGGLGPAGPATMRQINPDIRVEALEERAGPERLAALVRIADVVLDCSDNFATRHALNRACVAARKPLVSGAGIR